MAGTLYHGQDFEKRTYKALDGAIHYEVVPINGALDVVSASSWLEVKEYCERRGMPRDLWPDFDDGVDVPIELVSQKSKNLAIALMAIPREGTAEPYWLSKLLEYLGRGEKFFYAQD